MRVFQNDGKDYRLPGDPSEFQKKLYYRLIDWKRKHITQEAGVNRYRGIPIEYDAILPTSMAGEHRMIYPPVRPMLKQHSIKNPFREHSFFNHMASSQAAAVNLFLPVLCNPAAHIVLKSLKPDFASLATDHLDRGFCLEFWGGNLSGEAPKAGGPLGDKSETRGTDSDIAIAYRNPDGELCLWLIEHKLCEKEFTPCSGPKSRNRDKSRHDCGTSFAGLLQNKPACFHHDFSKRKYWEITGRNRDMFVGHTENSPCPFQGGMNQLWRNLLLALAVEQDDAQPYSHASFSVVKHPANPHLDDTLTQFKQLIGNNPRFSVFTSEDVLRAAETLHNDALTKWARWYRDLYIL